MLVLAVIVWVTLIGIIVAFVRMTSRRPDSWRARRGRRFWSQ